MNILIDYSSKREGPHFKMYLNLSLPSFSPFLNKKIQKHFQNS